MRRCLVCGHNKLFIVAEAGLGENVECDRCGSLHLAVRQIGKWELLRSGKPKAKIVFLRGEPRYGEEVICDSDKEALRYLKANWVYGMYIIDSGGAVLTDGRYRP